MGEVSRSQLLRVEGLVKIYGRRPVVNGVDFEVDVGEIVGLLGPNGAGKTTSFRATIGMITPDRGEVYFKGERITHLPMYRRARRGIGYLSQEPSIFRQLTVEDNVVAVLEMRGMPRKERRRKSAELLEELGLMHLRRQRADTLSGGERRRLEITRTLAIDPSLILLDEPFSGIDPKVVSELQRILEKLKQRRIGILITDHNYRETLDSTDRSYVIFEGRVLRHGSAEELLADPDVQRVYLGERQSDDQSLGAARS
jgi:lipopolysaccharide export system ATP-binding protein